MKADAVGVPLRPVSSYYRVQVRWASRQWSSLGIKYPSAGLAFENMEKMKEGTLTVAEWRVIFIQEDEVIVP